MYFSTQEKGETKGICFGEMHSVLSLQLLRASYIEQCLGPQLEKAPLLFHATHCSHTSDRTKQKNKCL